MPNNSRVLPLSMSIGGRRIYDPFSWEVAQAFLESECVSNALDNTFAAVQVEFEDLDGLPWSKGVPTPRFESRALLFEPVSMQAEPDSPLGPVFGPEDDYIPTLSFARDWPDVPQAPACDTWGPCSPVTYDWPRRKLSRSSRTLEINFPSPQTDPPGPISSVPVSSKCEAESNEKLGASISRPPSTKGKRDRLGTFLVQELPRVDEDSSDKDWDLQAIAIGPPPRPSFT